MTKPNYLRHRPFLVVTTIRRPRAGVKTERAGWGDFDENWSVFERPTVVDSVTPKIMSEATVIIDVLGKSIVKNGYQNDAALVVQHYLEKFARECDEAVSIWTAKEARRKASAL